MSLAPPLPLPWERQPNESAKAFRAFVVFRDLKPDERSALAVGDRLGYKTPDRHRRIGRGPTTIERWSARFGWLDRAAAWDCELDRRFRESQFRERIDMAKRHAAEALALQNVAVQRLREIAPGQLSADQLLRWLVEGIKLERLCRGESTENVQYQQHLKVNYVYEAEITRRVLADPQATELLCRLHDFIAGSAAYSGGLRLESDGGPVHSPAAPVAAEPPSR